MFERAGSDRRVLSEADRREHRPPPVHRLSKLVRVEHIHDARRDVRLAGHAVERLRVEVDDVDGVFLGVREEFGDR